MKTYWDSSAVIAALHDERMEARCRQPGQVTRVHTLAECFSTLTGGKLEIRYLPNDAAEMLADITCDFEFVELGRDETLKALSTAQSKGVRGGRVHDFLHVVAAVKAGAAKILTLDDFAGLEKNVIVEAP